MSTFYLDTSAAVKLYVSEAGSDWLRHLRITDQSHIVVSSHLLRVELRSAFARRLREESVTLEAYARMSDWFAEHRHMLYRFVPADEVIIRSACELIEHYPLRGYDAVHLATALIVNRWLIEAGEEGLTFLSADVRLNDVAAAEGLVVDNPKDHP
jgi:predicted nucleic acid-binding protein